MKFTDISNVLGDVVCFCTFVDLAASPIDRLAEALMTHMGVLQEGTIQIQYCNFSLIEGLYSI